MASKRPSSSPPPSSPSRGAFLRALITLAKIGVVAAIFGAIALVVAVAVSMASLPSFDELKASPNGQTIQVHARDGTVIMALGPSYGQWLSSAQIPGMMSDAMVAVEDRRFYSHPGVDPIGIARASYVNFKRGGNYQGASTITQQLARNIFLTNARSFTRKGREVILALALERRFSKQQIIELYLNRVYFGGGAYGIDAASRRFFGHSANRLSLEEAAIIAGLVKAPSRYAPSADPAAARGRAGVVIDTMVETGKITRAQASAADLTQARLAPQPRENSVRYFTDWALDQMDTLIDETAQPIDVYTTLDLRMQRSADAAIVVATPAGSQGALVAMSNDGAVRAMVGGRDYVSSIYNRATQAVRQPGSSFKLFDYLAALEAGHTPYDEVVDEPVTIEGWSPRNSTGTYAGAMTLREAFARSINTVAVKLAAEAGFSTVADMARRMGITTPVSIRPAMALGSSEVRLIDMTRAYASIANKGIAASPYGIIRITTNKGDVLYERPAPEARVLVAPTVAAAMTDLMKAAVETGTGRAAQIGRPLAGKTGTTSSNKDGWFLGFTGDLTAGVWMGRDDGRAVPGLQGGRAPARAFAAFMIRALSNVPISQLTTDVPGLGGGQLEPDDEVYGAPVGGNANGGEFVGPDGAPTDGGAAAPVPGEPPSPPAGDRDEPRLTQRWLDGVLGPDGRPAP